MTEINTLESRGAASSGLGRHGRRRNSGPASWRSYTATLVALDLVAIVVGAVSAQFIRFASFTTPVADASGVDYWMLSLAISPAWVATMALTGAYQRRYLGAGTDEYRRVFDGALRFLALLSVTAFVFDLALARGFVAVAIPLACATALGLRWGLRWWLNARRKHGAFTEGVVVVGSIASSRDLIESLRRTPFTGFTVVGVCLTGTLSALDADEEPVPVLGTPEEVWDAVLRSGATAIAIADTTTLSNGALRRLSWQLEGTGVDLMVAPGLTDVAGPRISIRPVAGLPLLHVEEPDFAGPRRLGKAAFDRVFAGVGLVVLSPVMLAIALAVRLTSHGPALFKQTRVGIGARTFMLVKFRTMTVDAEDRLSELVHLNEHDGLLFKITDDPRMTRLGRWLRRWSLDELPQLWNILRGEMSIVGPRPPLPSEVDQYTDDLRRRLLVKPGLTGLWQVSGRAELPWKEAVRLDLYYIENWSLSLDLVILTKTFLAVLRRRGAC